MLLTGVSLRSVKPSTYRLCPLASIERFQNKISPVDDAGFRKQHEIVAEVLVGGFQVRVFGHGLFEAMPPLLVGAIDLRPGRR